MNCEQARRLLDRLHDGELDAADRDLVGRHVEHCPSCAGELAAMAQLDQISRQLRSLEPPPDLWDRIAQRLDASPAVPSGRHAILTRRQFVFTGGVVAVSAVGGLLTVTIVRRRNAAIAVLKKAPNVSGPVDSIPVVSKPVGSSPVFSNSVMSGHVDPMTVNMALLKPEDRRLADAQKMCAADGCPSRLGAEIPPVKLIVHGTPVFLCSHQCELWAQAHPEEALSKARMLLHQHHSATGGSP